MLRRTSAKTERTGETPMKNRILLFPVLVSFLLLLSAAPAGGESTGRKLTLMVYMCGSNLESASGAATEDILEMKAAVPDSGEVAVLVMTGGTDTGGSDGFFSTSAVEIHEISAGRTRRVWQSEEALSMGSAHTLRKLLDYGPAYYPAEAYALILWNHGGGPLDGICWDELFSMDPLSLAELTYGLSSHSCGRLSWIGFDACLMATAEVAAAVAPFAHYMIASQETEPASGWDYSFLREIGGDADGAATGKRIVDCYFRSLEGSREILTLSCLNLDRIGEVVTGMDAFFSAAAENINEETFSRFSEIRLAAAGLGKSAGNPGGSGYDLADLTDLIGRFDVAHAELDRALEETIVYSRSSRDGIHGLSVYHPYANKERYAQRWKNDYQQIHFCDGYTRYANKFGAFLMEAPAIDWSGLQTETSGYDENGVHRFSLQLTPEQQADCVSAQLLILREADDNFVGYGKSFAMVFAAEAAREDDGRLTAEYDNRILTVADEQNRPLISRISFSLEDGLIAVRALCFDNSGGSETRSRADVIYLCDSSGDPEILQRQVYDPVTGHYTNRLAFSEDGYTDLYFRFEPRNLPDPAGVLPAFALWEESTGIYLESIRLSENWHFHLAEDQHPGGLYAVFQVTDSRQNTYSSLPVPLTNPQERSLAVTPDLLETDLCTLHFSAGMNVGNESPGLHLDFDIAASGDREQSLVLKEITVNGTLCVPDFSLGTLAPGEQKKIRFSPAAVSLTGVDEIRRIDAVLEISDTHDLTAETVRIPVSLEPEACDLSRFTAERPPVIAECEQDGILWQLLSLQKTPDGRIEGLIYLENRSDAPYLPDGAVCLNRVLAVRYFHPENYTKIPPGTGFYLPFSFEDALRLSFLESTVASRSNEAYARIDNYLEQIGVPAVERVDLYPDLNRFSADSAGSSPVSLLLPEPVPLSGETSGIHSFKPLLTGAVSAEIVQAFAADDTVSLLLRFTNDTEETVRLILEDAHLNGKEAGFSRVWPSEQYALPAGTQALTYVTFGNAGLFREKAALKDADFLFRISDASGVRAGIAFPEGTAFGKDGGTLLSADQLTVAAPVSLPGSGLSPDP